MEGLMGSKCAQLTYSWRERRAEEKIRHSQNAPNSPILGGRKEPRRKSDTAKRITKSSRNWTFTTHFTPAMLMSARTSSAAAATTLCHHSGKPSNSAMLSPKPATHSVIPTVWRKICVNPLTPRRTLVAPFTNISILFFKKGSSKKFPMSVAPMSR